MSVRDGGRALLLSLGVICTNMVSIVCDALPSLLCGPFIIKHRFFEKGICFFFPEYMTFAFVLVRGIPAFAG